MKTKHKKKRNHKKRRGLFEGLVMEEQWLAARSWLKKMTMVDVAGFIGYICICVNWEKMSEWRVWNVVSFSLLFPFGRGVD
jgi:hypothetical protein